MALTREAIFTASDLPREAVEVPEWGGSVWVRTLSAFERDAFEAATVRVRNGRQEPDLANLRGRLAALVICDEAGSRLFSDDDARALGDKSVLALERVLAVARRLNGLGEDAAEQAAKN